MKHSKQTIMNTTEKNKLIAEFMGLVGSSIPNKYWSRKNKDGIGIGELSYLRYHESFDWLMPVVEKILNRNVTPVKCKDIDEHLKQPEFLERKVYQKVVNTLVTCDIDAIYDAVIAFLTWYNEQ